MAPGNPPPSNGTGSTGGVPPRRSARTPGAGGPSQSPWAPTGAGTPRPATGSRGTSGTTPPSHAPAGRRAAGGAAAGRTATPAAAPASRRAAGSAAGSSGAARSGKRRLIDYPRQGKTGIRRWIPSWRLILGTFLFFVLLLVAGVYVAYARTEIPDPADLPRAQTTIVYYADEKTEIGRFSEQDRIIVDTDTIPKHVKDAVVAAEDRSFYENPGINPAGIARALWNNVRGGDKQGGSSITQQYAERYYVGETVTSYTGKIKEAFLAVKLDRQQDKDEILVNYLNTIYFGRDSYGIEVASQSYFGVGVDELTISQAALIAGVIPSPNNFDPRASAEEAERRWNYVLDGMVTTGTLTQEERDAQVFPETVESSGSETFRGPRGYLLDLVRTELLAKAPIEEADLTTQGYRIVTTLDPAMQNDAVRAAREALPEDKPKGLRTALVSLEPGTGAIKALYGGPDFIQIARNAVTQDRAQAGSTFKPFALVAHLESGNSLKTVYNGDSGIDMEGWNDDGTGPGNFAGQDFGQIDVAEATAFSVNTVYARMNIDVGPDKTVDVAVRAGLPEGTEGLNDRPSNVLGTASPHPIDMANAFNTFAAQGVRSTPHVVQTVAYADGELFYETDARTERVFEEDIMADTTYALTQVVEEGSGTKAQALNRPVAGKTGTSSDNKSAWFIGYTPQLTTAVALFQVGEDNAEAEIPAFGGVEQVTGSSFPLDIWVAYMTQAMEGMEVVPFPERADVGKPPVVDVPDVVGMSFGEATNVLEGAGFGVAVERVNDSAPRGQVLAQSPSGEATPGATVTITISDGPGTAGIPNVVGMPENRAASELRRAGFEVAVERAESADVREGIVISQNPSGEAPPGSTVTIVVSSGPPPEQPDPTEEPTENPGDGEEDTGGGPPGQALPPRWWDLWSASRA